jgi:hypothetical protein
MSIKGIIKSATIITLVDLDNEQGRKAQFLYGTIVSDSMQRFNEGNWFLSSVIVGIVENKIETRNSVYLVQDVPSVMEITMDEFRFVQQGHEPSIAKKLAHDNSFKTPLETNNHLSKKNKGDLDEFLSFLYEK